MADSSKTVAYDVSADASPFVKSMQDAADAAKTASNSIDAQFKKVQDVFSGVQKALLGITAVIAGGGAFKAVITETANWNGEAAKMAKQLGVTSEQASVLNVALKHLGIDSDTYTGAAAKMSKQIFSNGQAFEKLGVTLKTTEGTYRPMTDVMGEVNQKLAEIKNPIEQNIAGMQVYGKGWQEVRSILKVTTEQMSLAEDRARQLGLIVGPDGAAAAKQYKEQMRDLELVSKSLTVQFGNALLPVFTQTGQFLAEEGPAAGKVFADILKVIAFVASATWLSLKDMGDAIGAAAAQTVMLLHGDLEGFKAIGRARDEESAKNEAAFERMKQRFADGVPAPRSAAPETGGPNPDFSKDGKDKSDPSRMGAWEAALAEKKAALADASMQEGVLREYSKAEELAYWQGVAKMADLSKAEQISVSKKAADMKSAMVKDGFDQQVRVLDAEAAEYKNNADKRLEIEREIQAKYAQGTKGYEEAQKRINQITLQAAAQDKQVEDQRAQVASDHQIAKIQRAEQQARLEFDLGNISKAELLTLEQQFEDQRYDIAKKGLDKRLALAELGGDTNKVEIAKLNTAIEALILQHEAKLAEISASAAKDKAAPMMGGSAAIAGGMEQSLQALLTNTKNVNQQLASIWKQSYATYMQEMVTKPLAASMMRGLKETAIYKSMFGMQVTQQAAASGAVVGTKAAETAVVGGANAVQAGTGAFASLAAIPIIGPALAAVAGPAMFATVMAMVSRATHSAAGGFDIPSDINPVTQLHANEMVLPAQYANVIRTMGDQGMGAAGGIGQWEMPGSISRMTQASDLASRMSPPGSGGGSDATNSGASGGDIHIHTSGGEFIHKDDLAAVLKKLNRNFAFIR